MPRSTVSSAPRLARLQRQCALALALLLALPGGIGPVRAQPLPESRNALPSLGDSASEDFSVANERRLGERIMRDIRRDPDYLDDPLLLDYLQQLWSRLLDAARARGDIPAELDERFAWEMFLLRDRTVNAFALPGGYVGVHLGLVVLTTGPEELASVLAHEISHVSQRHIARSFGASKTSTLVGLAGLILGVLAASRSPEAASALITGGQAVAVQGQLNYSRVFEREADRVGFGVLTGAGYAPAGMASMFEKLQLASRLNDSQNFPYLRTHPLTSERIGEARSRLGVAGASA
ncbi:M48 family metalloprotease, partial [Methylibium sp.]|uniref:M48 family metallopeptidase n=1 Tax=Methylibium sp. TaxID=2067992 RepID=UPI00286C1BE6